MHWLLLLAVLSSTSGLKGGNTAQMNRLAENALRQQLGSAKAVKVEITPGKNGSNGDFDALAVTLDGFSADRLADIANKAANRNTSNYAPNSGTGNSNTRNLGSDDLGGLLKGDIGGILGGILNGKNGRIGHLRINASNFSYGGAQYDVMRADLGEIRFDWAKALRGEFDVKSIQPGNMLVQLRGDQAAKLLAPRLPSVRDVRVRFANGRAYLGGRASSYGLNVPFEVGAQLGVQQNRVMSNNFQASVANLRLPGFVLDQLTKSVNPLYDFDPQQRWPLAVNLQTAGTASNALTMKGGIQWLGFGKSRQQNTNRYPEDTSPAPRDQGRGDIFSDILNGALGR